MSSQRNLLRRAPTKGEATIMFLDIRGFAQLFNEHDPMEVLTFASTVLSELGMVVEASGGVVDKFTGDGFLAHFGILDPNTTHANDACWCAVRIRDAVVRLNMARNSDQELMVSVGMGIHTGMVASGVISTLVKSEFTVFGDVVNFASRIEGLTKDFAVDCLVSESVYRANQHQLTFQKMAHRDVRGFKTSQPTYWLLPTNVFLLD